MAIAPVDFFKLVQRNNIDFFTGVPDSLLKHFCSCVVDNVGENRHIIAANEGNAVAIATGYHLASNKCALVYLQNSGLGNTINPLISLADKDVYSIPMLLLIGWRGEPGKKDEPQHMKQGLVTQGLLQQLGVPVEVLPDTLDKAERTLKIAMTYIRAQQAPYALLVRKNTFEPYEKNNALNSEYALTREEALKLILDQLGGGVKVISTTGMLSRELFEIREITNAVHAQDFLNVGAMGHCSSIALGYALANPNQKMVCLDGDGSLLMHMGAVAINAQHAPKNFKHIVINNGVHDSVGAQPTVGFDVDVCAVAKACGYNVIGTAKTDEEIKAGIDTLNHTEGPAFLEIRVKKGARKDLGRPTCTPKETKTAFISCLPE